MFPSYKNQKANNFKEYRSICNFEKIEKKGLKNQETP